MTKGFLQVTSSSEVEVKFNVCQGDTFNIIPKMEFSLRNPVTKFFNIVSYDTSKTLRHEFVLEICIGEH